MRTPGMLRPVGRGLAPGPLLSMLTMLTMSALLGCGSEDASPPDGGLETGALSVISIDWSTSQTLVGSVAAVADAGDDVAIYSDSGAWSFTGGSLLGVDGSVRDWRAAAAVPALGFAGTWLLGLDGAGRLYRLRSHTALEDVTVRYGFADTPVRNLVPIGGAQVAFALDGRLAITDGAVQSQFELSPRLLAGGSGRVASVDEQGVQLFSPPGGTLHRHALAGCIGAAIGSDGRLWAATPLALFVEQEGALVQVFAAPTPDVIRGIVAAGDGIWLALGDTLALVRGGQLLRGPAGQLAADVRLVGSPVGDVWVIAGGQLRRFGEAGGLGADQQFWQQRLVPIYRRLCQVCHQPGGSAHIDLDAYSAWASRRALIGQRVVAQLPTPMPPVGTGALTPAELADVQTWVNYQHP